MKKQILNLGKELNKKEQKSIHGGFLDLGFFDDFGKCETTCKDGTARKCEGENCSATLNLGCTAGQGENKIENWCDDETLDMIL